MRPNYKALAEEYKMKLSASQAKNSVLYQEIRRLYESLGKQEQEIENPKVKYTEAMDNLIEMQERIWMQEEDNDG